MPDKSNNFLPRVDYSVFVLHVPQLRGKELSQAISYKLKMLYPGNLSDSEVIIKKNGKQKGSYLVFVVPKDLPKKPILLSTLFLQQALKKKTAIAFYIDTEFIEIVKITQGTVEESIIKKAKSVLDICEYIKTYCNKEDHVEIFYNTSISNELIRELSAELKTFLNKENFIFKDIETSLRGSSFDSICIHSQYSARKKYLKITAAAFTLTAIFAAVYGSYQYKIISEENSRQYREEQLHIERRLQRERSQRDKLSNLEAEYISLVHGKKLKPFEILRVISSCLDRSVLIISLTIRENNFQMEALASDPLVILRNFENNNQISNVNMNQILPDQSRERFSVTGVVLPTKRYIPDSYIIEEKINLFEAFILEEKEQGNDGVTASAFGISVRDALRINNCVIKSYQYLGYGKEREVEFSIQAGSRDFFNFLKTSSMPSYNWSFSIVQIRNLFPRDALDIVIRIKADFDIDDSNSLKAVSENDVAIIEKEVAEITRNYFTAPQRAAPVSVATIEPPVPQREPERPSRENITWLTYVGVVGEANGKNYIYMKNARDNRMLKFELNGTSNMSCRILDSGNIEVVMDNRIYEVKRVGN